MKIEITMKEYYDNPALSQSKLKLLLGDPKKFIELEDSELFFEEKQHFIIGNAVDCLITRGKEAFEKEFYISNLENKPSDVVKSIINEVFSKTNEDKTFTNYTNEILESCNNHNYQSNWKSETRVNKILENYHYWKELVNSEGKIILTESDNELIKSIVESFYTSKGTKDLFEQNDKLEIKYQLPIYFKWLDIDCKSLLDMVIFNHHKKEVKIIDIKTTGDRVINFPKNAEKNGYSIQCAFYWKAMEEYLIQNKMFDYKIGSFSFAVESTTDVSGAVLYETTEGFRVKGLYGEDDYFKSRKGILQLLDDFKYYLENGFQLDREIKEKNYHLKLS